ncbi:MAG: PEGA domain-containing protein [Myxococcales bacterium]|nr:PEGA domain-containing protein [Myxococcales bacterium]
METGIPRAWTVLAVALLAAGSAAHRCHAQRAAPEGPHANDPQVDEARAAIRRGESLFRAQNYDAALAEFTRAHSLLAGDPRGPAVLNNIAVCHERMFRYDLALHYYERYLKEAHTDEADRREVQGALTTLRNLLARVRIETNVAAQVWMDGRPIGEAPGEILIPAGRHVIEVRAPVYETARREIIVGARDRQTLTVTLGTLSDFRGLDSTLFFVSAGTAAAAAATALVLGLHTAGVRSAGKARAERDMYLATLRAEEDQDRVQRWALATDLAIGAAALLATTSVVLAFLTDWDQDEHQPARIRQADVRIRLVHGPVHVTTEIPTP